VQLKKGGELARICDECDALWLEPTEVGKVSWVDFGTYMQQRNQKGVWDELKILAE
jgi:hypothetical protein